MLSRQAHEVHGSGPLFPWRSELKEIAMCTSYYIPGLFWGDIGIMEKKMETPIVYYTPQTLNIVRASVAKGCLAYVLLANGTA